MPRPAFLYVRKTDQLPALGTTTGQGDAALARVKLVSPYSGWVWLLLEYDAETQEAFGLVQGFEEELGYIDLAELAACRVRGVPAVERDLSWTPRPLAACRAAARRAS